MINYFKDEGLVIGVKNFKESDGLVIFFGKNYGKIYGLVKNLKRSTKNISLFDQSHYLKIFAVSKNEKIKIISGLILKELNILEVNLKDWLWALKLVNKILPPLQPENQIFNLLLISSLILKKPTINFKSWFGVKILYLNGILEKNPRCQKCERKLDNSKKIYFSNNWYCPQCKKSGFYLKLDDFFLLKKLINSPKPIKVNRRIVLLVKNLIENFLNS